MPTSAAGNNRSRPGRVAAQRGFTLIELLVALLIVAVLTGVAALSLSHHASDAAQREADRLAALLETARQQALLGGQPLAWVALPDGYAFARPGPQGWELMREPPLQPRRWDWSGDGEAPQLLRRLSASRLQLDGGVQLVLSGGLRDPAAGGNWLVFAPEPVQPALQVDLVDAGVLWRVASDGLQPFQVEVRR